MSKPTALLINVSDIGDIVSSMVVLDCLIEKGYEVFFHTPNFCKGLFEADKRVAFISLDDAKKKKFDITIDLSSHKQSRKIVRQIRSKMKVGRVKDTWQKMRHWITYTHMVSKKFTGHIIEDYYPILVLLNDSNRRIPFLQSVSSGLKQRLGYKTEDKIVSIHFGAHNPKRVIPENLISGAIKHLDEHGYKIFLLGTETEIAEDILKKNNNIPQYKKLNLAEVKEILTDSSLFIGADSGILHMASALKTNSIGIYGPNTPKRSGPRGEKVTIFDQPLDCRPCNQNIACPIDVKCMKTLSLTDFLKLIDNKLGF